MFNDFNNMKSFSLDIPVLKETIAKLEISIQNIEKIGTDVENIGDKLIFESWEGKATNKFKEHQQDWKKGYDDMLKLLIDFKESLEKVVFAGAEEINELALELPTPLGGSKGAGYRNIISMEQEGIEDLKTECKTLVYEDYEYQREIMEKIESLSNRLNYPYHSGADAVQNIRTIEENQDKLQSYRGKLQNYEYTVLQFEKEVVDEMSKYAVICGHKLDAASFREILKYQKDDSWKALLTKNVEELSDIEKYVLKADYERGIADKISQYINIILGIEDLGFENFKFENVATIWVRNRLVKLGEIIDEIDNILNKCEMLNSAIELKLGKNIEYVKRVIPFISESEGIQKVVNVHIQGFFNNEVIPEIKNIGLKIVDKVVVTTPMDIGSDNELDNTILKIQGVYYITDGYIKIMSGNVSGYQEIGVAQFEIRGELNGELVTYETASQNNSGWTLLPPELSIYHDNGHGNPELKYVNEDGREAVFDGDTLKPIYETEFKATYNYVTPVEMPEETGDIKGWSEFAIKGAGHFIYDMLPYYMNFSKNERNQD